MNIVALLIGLLSASSLFAEESTSPPNEWPAIVEQMVPYQTLIASVLHKYVTGCLAEPDSAKQRRNPTAKSRAASGA